MKFAPSIFTVAMLSAFAMSASAQTAARRRRPAPKSRPKPLPPTRPARSRRAGVGPQPSDAEEAGRDRHDPCCPGEERGGCRQQGPAIPSGQESVPKQDMPKKPTTEANRAAVKADAASANKSGPDPERSGIGGWPGQGVPGAEEAIRRPVALARGRRAARAARSNPEPPFSCFRARNPRGLPGVRRRRSGSFPVRLAFIERASARSRVCSERLAGAIDRHAGREGDEHRLALVHEQAHRERTLQPGQGLLALGDRGRRQQHDEFSPPKRAPPSRSAAATC